MDSGCIDILYAHVSRQLAISREQYEATLKEWAISPIHHGGEVVGAVMTKGNEIHVAIDPFAWRTWATRDLSRKYLVDGIKRHGHMVTSAMRGNAESINFIKRLGFYQTSENEQTIHFRIDHAKIR